MAARDFFISYTTTDKYWAEWVAWALEDVGFSVFLQAWDIGAGKNFILEMDRAARDCERTIVIMSRSYLASAYAQPEWAQSFAKDPLAEERLLIPVRVDSCNFQGILQAIVWIDLVDADEAQALSRLLNGIRRGRAKPSEPPPFPNTKPGADFLAHPRYPPSVKVFDRRTLSADDLGTLSINLGEVFLDKIPEYLINNPQYKTIVFFDIDGQGAINRKFGVPIGNKVLHRVSQILKQELGNNETFHRCGDDTFFALLPVGLATALDEAKRIVDCVKHFSSWSDLAPALDVRCSGGVYAFPPHRNRSEQSIDDAVFRAAVACRSARLVGGDRVLEGPSVLTPEDELTVSNALSRRLRNIHSGAC